MKYIIHIFLGTALIWSVGCTTTQHVNQVQRPPAFNELVSGFSSEQGPAATLQTSKPEKITVAVAQVGKTVPPQVILDAVNAHSEIIDRVVAMPLVIEENPRLKYRSVAARPVDWQTPFNTMVHGALKTARSEGADYVFIIGDLVESNTELSSTEVIDILVVPIFTVPSRKVSVSARTSGAMFDTNTGEVVFTLAETSQASSLTASAYEDRKIESMSSREKSKTTDEVAQQLHAHLEKMTGNTLVTINR